MAMPLADLKAIYELLFRDGVIVAKRDKRPQSMHPDVKGVTNLKVICALGSLKSKGCVRETFAWKHAYYYITNDGIAYLRDYLHLPPKIMPATLQRVRCPVSSARVQMVKGPTAYAPKPKPRRESQETMMDRHIYRPKRVGEQTEQSEGPSRSFRGSYQCDAAAGLSGVQTQTFFRTDDFCDREERWTKQGNRKSFGAPSLATEYKTIRCCESVKEAKPHNPLVSSPSVITKFSHQVPTVHTTPSAPVKRVQQKCVEITAGYPPAAFESEHVKMQQAVMMEPTDLISDVTREETSNLVLEVLAEVGPKVKAGEHAVMDQQVITLFAEVTEKQEQQDFKDEEGVLEEVDLVTEVTVETCNVEMMKELNVKVFCPEVKAKSDPDHASAAPPSTATDKFRDLKKKEVMVDDMDNGEDNQIEEKTILMKAISSGPDPLVPSKSSVAALKTTLPQEDQEYLSKTSEKEQDDQRVWPEFLTGLSLSYSSSSSSSSSASSSFLSSAVEAIWALLWALLVFGNLREG